jgi:intracellular sulfur oxidation DsrE/DsrF family protein
MKKVVIHIFHADNSSLGTGSHVSERIRQVKDQHGVELEVYVFGPAERALDDPAHAEYRQTLVSLAKAGVPVHVCRDIAESMGKHRSSRLLALRWNTLATLSCAMPSREQPW